MLKRLLRRIVDHPPTLDLARRLIEADFRGEKEVIAREFGAPPGRLLDVPCGTGLFSPLFSERSYTGVDLARKYVERARRRNPGKTFLVGDVLDLQFQDACFDHLLVIGLLHHLDETDVHRALQEMRRVLDERGKILLIEDCPTRSPWNLLGRLMQALDQGDHIRPSGYYQEALATYFEIERSYPMRSGVWDYFVFVLRPRPDGTVREPQSACDPRASQ